MGGIISSRFVPPLTHNLYKGQMGRIGVSGGSPDYTGAPYYSGEAAIRFGADLSSIYCAQEASLPIKSYSPELMVTPFYSYGGDLLRSDIQLVTAPLLSALPRLHSIVIGPGLGRDPRVAEEVMGILTTAVKSGKQ